MHHLYIFTNLLLMALGTTTCLVPKDVQSGLVPFLAGFIWQNFMVFCTYCWRNLLEEEEWGLTKFRHWESS